MLLWHLMAVGPLASFFSLGFWFGQTLELWFGHVFPNSAVRKTSSATWIYLSCSGQIGEGGERESSAVHGGRGKGGDSWTAGRWYPIMKPALPCEYCIPHIWLVTG